jgi:hypothetical protein
MVDTTLVYTDGTPLLSRAALTGDVTASAGSNATTIANDAVTYAKIQDVTDARLLGRSAGSAGDVQEITVGAGLSLSAGALTNTGSTFTTEDAQDAVGAMVDASLTYVDGTPLLQRAALTGDVTAAAGSNATTIANDAVTFGKIQNISGDTLLGRDSGSPGDVQEITMGTNMALSFGSLSCTLESRRSVGVTFDGNGSTPTVGSIGYVVCPFVGEVESWSIVANASGSAVVDVWKAAGAIPTNANSIAGTGKPTLASQQLNSDPGIANWTTYSVAASDVFGFELESVSTCTRVTVEVVMVV